jgi:ABC-2 type transport system permease protein
MINFLGKLSNSLYIIWAIAWKDIVDAIRSRLFLTVALGSIVLLSLPRLMLLMFEQPAFPLVIYDPGSSQIISALEKEARISVTSVPSLDELEAIISSLGIGLGPQLGIALPVDFDQMIADGRELPLDVYVVWANRSKAVDLAAELEALVIQISGQPLGFKVDNHLLYPQDDTPLLGILVIGGITMLLVIGIALVPFLMIEEKQTKTMEALLVSPASVSQVVSAKAVAGFFYIIVAAGIVIAFYLTSVVHWGVLLLFVIASGVFAVALGLVMGSSFENPQEISGWLGIVLVLLVGAMLVDLMSLDLPSFVYAIHPWVPSVALADIFRMALAEEISTRQLWTDVGVVMLVSALLYALVVWQVRRSDR